MSRKDEGLVYANEADLINKAVFGKTAKEWRQANSEEKGNIRDHASVELLLVLANVENYNAILIEEGKSKLERLFALNADARRQFKSLTDTPAIRSLKPPPLLRSK